MQAQSNQSWNAALYDDKHSFVWKHGASLLALLEPKAGERILDLGCGTGHLTAQIAAVGAVVVGIDSSPAMIETARTTYPQLRFETADARNFDLGMSFDAVFSNAVLHWIKEPDSVISRIGRALKPGGRFVAELGGKGNVQTIVAALNRAAQSFSGAAPRHPWYYPSIGEYAGLLEKEGLEVAHAVLFDRPTPLEGDTGMRNWIEMFGGEFLKSIPAERFDEFLARVEGELRPVLFRDGTWFADYRRLRIVARRNK
jgi:trans-aconitate 2-methyltransferase